jgi:hypothetical protein
MKTRTFYESLGRLTLNITLSDAKNGSHLGQCDDDIKSLLKKDYIKRQFAAIQPDTIRESLKEYGAWDQEELSDDIANQERLLWIACGDIVENATASHE